ncbi:MAG: hypothetical protein J6K91_02635 [Opitutales bacterium]|nr:hypothetical protein [Opitutales bacterium]
MKVVFYFVLVCLSLSLFSGCDYIKEKKEILEKKMSNSETSTIDVGVQNKLKELAKKNFPNSQALQEEWVSKQYGAYEELSKFIPDMPLNEYTALRNRAEAKYQSDYVARLKYMSEQTNAYYRLKQIRVSFSDKQWDEIYALVDAVAPDNYIEKIRLLHDWKYAMSAINARKHYFSTQEIDAFYADLCKNYPDKPRKFVEHYENCAVAKYKFDRFVITGVKKDVQDDVKKLILKKTELSYPQKYTELQTVLTQIKKDPSVASKILNKKITTDESAELRNRAEEIFRQSIFTKRGAEEEIYTAALVKMNGKVVVLATKHFIPEKFPVVFANSHGKIVCSKGYISDSHPMILLIPDEVPSNFTPIEVVSNEDSLTLFDRELFMIAPAQGGFISSPVSVFSEDNDYLNLTAATNPSTSYSTSVKPLGRNGQRLLISIVEKVKVGENSVVIDSKTGKLVSMAVRVYNAGVISHFGKTGNVIGHENFAIPDFSTFVRQFDGTVNKTDAPRSSIRFVRMTAFENWKLLDVEKFQKQKNEIRLFTDDNNDFLMFFKSNMFNEALRSRRLGRIAERYRKPLLYDNITRESFERYYRNYMIDVAYALKRELAGNKNEKEFYSIYRQEYKYQNALREAMYKYISEGLEDKNIMNIIHTDLTTRYNNSSHNNARIGGSIGGGY